MLKRTDPEFVENLVFRLKGRLEFDKNSFDLCSSSYAQEWEESFIAGNFDVNGEFMGGS